MQRNSRFGRGDFDSSRTRFSPTKVDPRLREACRDWLDFQKEVINILDSGAHLRDQASPVLEAMSVLPRSASMSAVIDHCSLSGACLRVLIEETGTSPGLAGF